MYKSSPYMLICILFPDNLSATSSVYPSNTNLTPPINNSGNIIDAQTLTRLIALAAYHINFVVVEPTAGTIFRPHRPQQKTFSVIDMPALCL